jgi:hypothetical protein
MMSLCSAIGPSQILSGAKLPLDSDDPDLLYATSRNTSPRVVATILRITPPPEGTAHFAH